MSTALRLYEPGMTADEFHAWGGDGTGRRWQLIDGEPVAMSTPTEVHSRLQARLARLIGNHLAAHRPECEALINPGVRPRTDAARNVRSPDVGVTCSPVSPRWTDAPLFVAEILSPSNARETREAVRACLTIPSLREVLVLGSEEILAEVLLRDADGVWPVTPQVLGPGGTIVLESLGFAHRIDELYAGLGLDA